jgi:hypothetical protein
MVERYHREEIMRQSVGFWGPPIVSLENVSRMQSLHIESKRIHVPRPVLATTDIVGRLPQ